jgi:hypothetical protein
LQVSHIRSQAIADRVSDADRVRHEEHGPVPRYFEDGLTPAQARLALERLTLAIERRWQTGHPLKGPWLAAIIAGVVSAVTNDRVGNSSWGWSMHGKRGGLVMARHELYKLREISPKGARASVIARDRRKAREAFERDRVRGGRVCLHRVGRGRSSNRRIGTVPALSLALRGAQRLERQGDQARAVGRKGDREWGAGGIRESALPEPADLSPFTAVDAERRNAGLTGDGNLFGPPISRTYRDCCWVVPGEDSGSACRLMLRGLRLLPGPP